ATLTGTGSITVNAGGLMVHRNEGVLDVNTTIASMGNMYVNREPTLSSILTNNGTMTLLETGDFNFADGTLINNGLFTFLATANVFVRSVSGTNLIQNTSTGIFRKEQATGFIAIAVALQNQGTFEGLGEFSLNNIASNSGRFSPGGNTVGILEVNEQSITGHFLTVRIQIGNVTPGVGHDQLQVNGTTSLSTVTLSVAGTSDAPVGLYTVMTTTSGAFTGNFAALDIPANYSLVYTPGTNVVRVQKNSMVLPLNWGTFHAVAKNNTVALSWTTLNESNTSLFVIEHSVDGRSFTQIGTANAAGNSNSAMKYAAAHNNPALNGTNYSRIKQVDIDGKSTYSKTITVQFKNASVILVQALPNPVVNTLNLSVQGKGVAVVLTSAAGTTVRNLKLTEGQHPVDLSNLPSGVYHLSIYQDEKYIETKRIVKQ
ncbi:MAG TPA: T9SS type A sorting domain-containing protein, partial [Flavisolibacter sp.]